MGFFSDLKAAVSVQKIKTGGTAKLSISQITCLIVNMSDAKRNLEATQFEEVYSLYCKLRKCKTKITLDINGYYDISAKIVVLFNKIAPYEKFSGMNEIEAKFLLTEIEQLYGDEELNIDIPQDMPEPKRKNKAIIPLVIALMLSLGALVYVSVRLHNSVNKEEYNSLLQSYENSQQVNMNLRRRIASIGEEKMDAINALDFWQNRMVLVTAGGNKYHNYGCFHLEGRETTIYSISTAKSRGYEPCLSCKPAEREPLKFVPIN